MTGERRKLGINRSVDKKKLAKAVQTTPPILDIFIFGEITSTLALSDIWFSVHPQVMIYSHWPVLNILWLCNILVLVNLNYTTIPLSSQLSESQVKPTATSKITNYYRTLAACIVVYLSLKSHKSRGIHSLL